MSTTAPCIGIAIVSYNTRELLRACLDSLGTCSLPLRIVVVDNQSRDGSAAMLRASFPHVELIEPGRNLGFAAGTNIALAALLQQAVESSAPRAAASYETEHTGVQEGATVRAACDYFLLLNSDTLVHTGAIETLLAFLEAHPRVGMLGPRLLNTDGSVQAAAFRFPTLSMSLLDLFPPGEVLPGRLYGSWWHGRYPQEEQASAPFPIDHPLGACILVRRSVIEEIGLLDEGYFMYAEEVDWCLRAQRAGWAIWQQPAARVTHVGGASTSQFRAAMHVALYRSRLRFFRKFHAPGSVRLHRFVIAAGSLRAIGIAYADFVRGKLSREALQERLQSHGLVLSLMFNGEW